MFTEQVYSILTLLFTLSLLRDAFRLNKCCSCLGGGEVNPNPNSLGHSFNKMSLILSMPHQFGYTLYCGQLYITHSTPHGQDYKYLYTGGRRAPRTRGPAAPEVLVQYNTIQCNAIQYNKIKYNKIQYGRTDVSNSFLVCVYYDELSRQWLYSRVFQKRDMSS